MPAKKGCTYSRDSKGKCRSMESHYAYTSPKGRKKGCSNGPRVNGRCLSKKAFYSKQKSAAKRIQKAFRKKSR